MVTFKSGKLARLAVAMALLFAVTAALLLLILPRGRESIDYLIAGSFAAAVSLAVLFGLCVRRGFFSTRKR
jgi:hypothetical protein